MSKTTEIQIPKLSKTEGNSPKCQKLREIQILKMSKTAGNAPKCQKTTENSNSQNVIKCGKIEIPRTLCFRYVELGIRGILPDIQGTNAFGTINFMSTDGH